RLLPGAAAVIRAIDPAGVGFDHRPDPIGIGGRDRHAGPSPQSLGQALAVEALPGVPTVGALPEPAAGAAALQAPRGAPRLPGRGVEHTWILGIHAQVHRAGAVVHEQHAFPGGATVPRAEHAALVIDAERVSERRDVRHFRVPRIDADAPDLARI